MHIEIHPIFVHFPIALIMVVLILDWGRWIFARESLLSAGFWGGTTPLLIIALAGAIGSVLTGLQAEEGVEAGLVVHELIEAHEMAAFFTTGIVALLTFWRVALRGAFPNRLPLLYLFLLICAAAIVGYGAYFGGLMVYSHGVGPSLFIAAVRTL